MIRIGGRAPNIALADPVVEGIGIGRLERGKAGDRIGIQYQTLGATAE